MRILHVFEIKVSRWNISRFEFFNDNGRVFFWLDIVHGYTDGIMALGNYRSNLKVRNKRNAISRILIGISKFQSAFCCCSIQQCNKKVGKNQCNHNYLRRKWLLRIPYLKSLEHFEVTKKYSSKKGGRSV